MATVHDGCVSSQPGSHRCGQLWLIPSHGHQRLGTESRQISSGVAGPAAHWLGPSGNLAADLEEGLREARRVQYEIEQQIRMLVPRREHRMPISSFVSSKEETISDTVGGNLSFLAATFSRTEQEPNDAEGTEDDEEVGANTNEPEVVQCLVSVAAVPPLALSTYTATSTRAKASSLQKSVLRRSAATTLVHTSATFAESASHPWSVGGDYNVMPNEAMNAVRTLRYCCEQRPPEATRNMFFAVLQACERNTELGEEL